MTPGAFHDWLKATPRRPLVMGVLNVTPDSFSDGGRYLDPDLARAQALRMIEAGADLIDIGGESTRPGAEPVEAGEQTRRVIPAIESIVRAHSIAISIDTTRAAVARAALEAGTTLVNDISAGREDPQLLDLAAARGAPIVLMHMRGAPRDMQRAPHYQDVTAEVREFLLQRAAAAESAGVARERILLDPGIGFGKTTGHNLRLLHDLRQFKSLGFALLVGTSRKRFIGEITHMAEPASRLFGTAATVAWSVANGADMVRVHDVAAMRQVVQMTQALISGASEA